MADVRRVHQGDTKRRRWELRQRGAVVPLDTASEVRMLMDLAPGQSASGTTTLNGLCTIEVPAFAGIVKEPVGGLGALALALYLTKWRITWTSGEIEFIPDDGWQEIEIIP